MIYNYFIDIAIDDQIHPEAINNTKVKVLNSIAKALNEMFPSFTFECGLPLTCDMDIYILVEDAIRGSDISKVVYLMTAGLIYVDYTEVPGGIFITLKECYGYRCE